MIDVKPTITPALRNSEAIASLIGRDQEGIVKVYPQTTPDEYSVDFPYITYFEITNFEANHADDDELQSEIHIQVDVWSKGNTEPISTEVNRIMKSLGFMRTGTKDEYERDTKVYHKILRFKLITEV